MDELIRSVPPWRHCASDRRAKSRRRVVGVIADGPGWGMAAEIRAGQGAGYRLRFGPGEETSPRSDPETGMDSYMDADGRFFPGLTRSSPCLDAPLTLRPITLRPSSVPVCAHPTRRGVLRCRPHRPRQPCNPPRSAVPARRVSSRRARVSQSQAPEPWAGPGGIPRLQRPELAGKPVPDPSPTIPTTIKRSHLP
jgi:hypothetical protein